jgi:hypothetical protein
MKTRTSLSTMRMTRSVLLVSALAVGASFAACSAKQIQTSSSGDSSNATSSSGMGGEGGTMNAGGAGGSGGGGGASGCRKDADCTMDPAGTLCDVQTGLCVECLPLDPPADDCTQGTYCNRITHVCEVGCTSVSDCNSGQTCDEVSFKCLGCLTDFDCSAGSICVSDTCIPGCSGLQPCQSGFSCCSGSCYDFGTDENNCGLCQNVCPVPPNGAALCDNGLCLLGTCKPAFADCNKDPQDGCEWNVLQDGPCACAPGQKQPCYQGAPGTNNIGVCKSGTQTCKPDGTGWGLCEDQVLPRHETCGNNLDDDCNGVVDDNADIDGDGWSSCGGDCCETIGPGCNAPKEVNPGAFEVLGDGSDNDCNPMTLDNIPEQCSSAAKFTGVTGTDMVKAMELCQFTTANPPLYLKRWGVISVEQLLSDGTKPTTAQLANIQDKQTAIMTAYGVGVVPLKGATFAGMSTGIMRDQDDLGYLGVSNNIGTTSQPPASYLLANGNKLPNSKGCSGTCEAGTGARDPVNLRLKIRTPTNAKSFTYQFRFFSSEYWSFQCTKFNDFFIGLYQSTWTPDPLDPLQKPLPLDKNVATDCSVTPCNPISVNNSFFDVCAPRGCNVCPAGTTDLGGTGMQVNNEGGATKWLFNDVPAVPGEVIQLELIIFDVEDAVNNSLVLLDNWVWNTNLLQGVHE